MKKAFVLTLAFLGGLVLAGLVHGEPTSSTPLRDKALAEIRQNEIVCREILEKNFAAFNAKDLDGFMATIHPHAGGWDKYGRRNTQKIAELREETKKLFEEATVHLRIVDFQVRSRSKPLYGTVVQETMTYDELSNEYRHRSALVPNDRFVVYTQTFMPSPEGWLLGPITTEPKPLVLQQVENALEEKAACADGKCRPLSLRLRIR